jgi:hypothetical protein
MHEFWLHRGGHHPLVLFIADEIVASVIVEVPIRKHLGLDGAAMPRLHEFDRDLGAHITPMEPKRAARDDLVSVLD